MATYGSFWHLYGNVWQFIKQFMVINQFMAISSLKPIKSLQF
jgi:hypothetical protein